jgi:hypothetical protein
MTSTSLLAILAPSTMQTIVLYHFPVVLCQLSCCPLPLSFTIAVFLQVFTVNNPMIAGLLAVLAAIYRTDLLKLPIKFEIESLFVKFELKIDNMHDANALQARMLCRMRLCLALHCAHRQR